MNTTNHNRVITEITGDKKIKGILEEASAYTDDPTEADKYFFYHFYYDIRVDGNTVQLLRVDYDKTTAYRNSMEKCGDKYDDKSHIYYDDFSKKSKLISYGSEKREWSSSTDKKEFFSVFINNKKKSEKIGKDVLTTNLSKWGNNSVFDVGNQSDNVAFLHAMGAAGDDNKEDSRTEFEKHLKKCFAEYLFLNNPEKATFMLGIALHGIMDSFTPSHMDFQKFSEQDWGLHAQGDVIPFENDDAVYDPGQISSPKASGKERLFAEIKKGYDGDDIINSREFEMFKIFLKIGDIDKEDETIKSILEDRADITVTLTSQGTRTIYNDIPTSFTYHSLHKLNDLLKKNNVKFGSQAFKYSETAIEVCKKVFESLSTAKQEINDHISYKNKKIIPKDETGKTVIDEALEIWKEKYDTFDRQPSSDEMSLFGEIRRIRGIDKSKNPFAE